MFDPNFMPGPHREVRDDARAFKRILRAAIRKHDPWGQESRVLAIHVGEIHGGLESLVVTLTHSVEHLQLEKVFRSFNGRRIFFVYTDGLDLNDELFNLLRLAWSQGQRAMLIIQPSEEDDEELDGEVFFADAGSDDEECEAPPFSAN